MKTLMPLFTLLALLATRQLFADESWMLYDDSQVSLVEVTMDPADLVWMYDNVHSDSLHPCTVHFQNALLDQVVDSVHIRLRGNTSRESAKKSFKLSFNTMVPGRQFHDVDKLNLNGEHNDPSIIRSKLCWDLFQELGMTSSRAAHTALYINGDYFGLYISVEHVDDEFLDNHYDDPSGNLWKCLWPADLVYLGEDPDLYKFYSYGRQAYELKTNEEEDDYSQLARLIDRINNTPAGLLADTLESILAVPEVLKYFAVDVLTGSWDDYWYLKNNYYLYHEPFYDLFHLVPYDYDNTFSIDWFGVDWATIVPYDFGSSEPRPLADRLLDNAQYRNLFTHFLEFYSDSLFELSRWDAGLDSLKDLITPWAKADSFRTLDYGFTINDFHQSYATGGYQNQHVARGLREFVNFRNTSLAVQVDYQAADPIVYRLDWTPGNPMPADSILVDCAAFSAAGLASVTILYYPGDSTVVEEYAMEYDPQVPSPLVEDADRWTGWIPPLGPGGSGAFRILAEGLDGFTQAYPRTHRIPLAAPLPDVTHVRLNEFMPKNDAYMTDPQGDYDDWLEILNAGDTAVDLTGFMLSDRFTIPDKWSFPDTTIAPGQYLLVWCDEDGGDPGLHADFKLSASGEELIFSSPEGAVLDSLSFGASPPDQSWMIPCDAQGPGPGGATLWELTEEPTPWAANGGCPDPVTQLEIVVSGADAILTWPAGQAWIWNVYRLDEPYGDLQDAELLGTVTQPFYVDLNAAAQPVGFYVVTVVAGVR